MWNKSAESVLVQLKALEQVVPYGMKDFHTDNGGEFLNWALYRHLTGRAARMPWTRSRAYRKNDNAHCEQKNWTHVRQLFGHERFGHAELVPLMNDLYAKEWSQFTNHFKPTFKLLKREKKNGRTKRIYEAAPQTPYQRLLESADISEETSNAPASFAAARAALGVAALRGFTAILRDAETAYLQAVIDTRARTPTFFELPREWWPDSWFVDAQSQNMSDHIADY